MIPFTISSVLVICLLSLVAPIYAIREIKCKEFDVTYYEYNKFYDLSLIKDVQSAEYYAKLPITFESDYGDIHVVFAESNETNYINRAYEFALGAYGNTLCEIRRKDNVHEKRNFNGNRFADYRIPTSPTKFNVELSISSDGVVQMKDLGKDFKFNFTDQLPVIPVKYVSFAGYRGSGTKVTFDCVEVPHQALPITTEVTHHEKINLTTTDNEIDAETVDVQIQTPTSTSFMEAVSKADKETTIEETKDDANDETNEIAPESTTLIATGLL